MFKNSSISNNPGRNCYSSVLKRSPLNPENTHDSVLLSQAGDDTLNGNDKLYGKGDTDLIYGGTGDDELSGGCGNDQ
ncbi:hypothetical protein [Microcoleus sp. EPA2]|uniref:hypothetical protein n=1 Tax=Microcoleus sp. EPA2 TaxID=2841654 RepID=UPI00312B5D92